MAFKNISKLTTRRQGEVIGQIYRLIACYSEFFVSRTRVYIKDIAKYNNSIYWLEHPKHPEVTAIAIVDPLHTLPNPYGNDFYLLGHTIAKLSNQMNTILDHINGDYEHENIICFTRTLFGKALQLCESYKFVPLTAHELTHHFNGLAELSTEYFSLSQQEKVVNAMIRRNYMAYIKFNSESLAKIQQHNPQFHAFIIDTLQHPYSE